MDISSLPPALISTDFQKKISSVPKDIANAPPAQPIKEEPIGDNLNGGKLKLHKDVGEPSLTLEEGRESLRVAAIASGDMLTSLENSVDTYDKAMDEILSQDGQILMKEWDLAMDGSELIVTGNELTDAQKNIVLEAFDDYKLKHNLASIQEDIITLASQPFDRASPQGAIARYDLKEENIGDFYSFRESIEGSTKANYDAFEDLRAQLLARADQDLLKEENFSHNMIEVEI